MQKWTDRDLVEEAFKEDGLLSKHFKGYSVREQQVELAKKIQETIKAGGNLVGEAPTGVGKSLAALIPAFETIVQHDAPVIIVTSSIILQEQYFFKDVPLLEKIFNYNVSPVLIKGRNNYLCRMKLNEFKAGNFTNTNSTNQKEITGILDWAEKTKRGDVSELDFQPKHAVWKEFATTGKNDCLGKQCPLYNECYYYAQRRKLNSSKLIICNYHYFFTAMNADGMLPSNAKVVIMDEGHEIAGIGRDFQEVKYTRKTTEEIFHNFLKMYSSIERSEGLATYMKNAMDYFELEIVNATRDQAFLALTKYFMGKKKPYSDNVVLTKDDRKEIGKMFEGHLKAIKNTRDEIFSHLEKHGLNQDYRFSWEDYYSPEQIKWQISVEGLYDSMNELAVMLDEYMANKSEVASMLGFGDEEPEETDGKSEVVYWVEKKNDFVSLHRKPASCADLTGKLFEDEKAMIVLSATLAIAGNFDHLKKDLGINEAEELVVTSPFDLTSNMLWYLPQNVPAGNSKEHQQFAINEMMKVIEKLHGRTLCLFTSNRNMTEAARQFQEKLPSDIEILVQNDIPKQKIIERMKANPNAVIVATRSFFTGVDIQGQNLSAVLIDKLPFPMIGDAVNDYLMSKDRGFFTFSLPEAIIALKQGFGRLNRTYTDKGVVALYDGRISTAAGYKNRIFNSFDFKLNGTTSWDEVCKFIDDIQM